MIYKVTYKDGENDFSEEIKADSVDKLYTILEEYYIDNIVSKHVKIIPTYNIFVFDQFIGDYAYEKDAIKIGEDIIYDNFYDNVKIEELLDLEDNNDY